MSRIKPALPKEPGRCPLPSRQSTDSFWHSEPSPLLTAHRSTRNLPEKADVVIIGSGMTGASVAHYLLNNESPSAGVDSNGQKKSLRVVMLEAREACWGATGRNGGHCQPLLLEHPGDPSIPAFELANYNALRRLTETKRIDCEFVPQSGVRAIYSLSNLHETELALHTLQTTDPEMAGLTRITRDENELARLRVPGALGAVVTRVAARMWPYKFVARILEDLLTATDLPGGEFNLQTLTPAVSLHRCDSGGWDVHTPRGAIQADKLVLATNAYTSHLLPAFTSLIVPVRGQMSALEPLPSVSGANRLKTSFGFAGEGIDDYLIQRPNESGGHLMFGGGRQFKSCVGVADDSTIDTTTAAYLRTRLVKALALPEQAEYERTQEARPTTLTCEPCRTRRVICSGPQPAIHPQSDVRCDQCMKFRQPCGGFSQTRAPYAPKEFNATHEWTGIMGFSRDDLPWVGEVPQCMIPSTDDNGIPHADQRVYDGSSGLFLAAGYTGHGMPNTWLCGASIAGGILGRDLTPWARGAEVPAAYAITRERIAKALELESVAARDWAEMERAWSRRRQDRPHSGYA